MRWFLLALVPFFLFGGLLVNKRSERAAETVTEQIDAFVEQQMARHHLPGLALAVTQADRVVYLKGYGAADDQTPITPQTQFYLASVSKSITALAVMQLVEAGKVDLDAPVRRYLPAFTHQDHAAAGQVTVRHLLNHTSGMADQGFQELRLPQMTTLAERIDSLRSASPVAAPGEEYYYFNPNYETLARLVEVASGQPFSVYLEEHVFAPLGMTATFHAIHTSQVAGRADRLAPGHFLVYSLPVPADELTGFIGGSGGVISTARDMASYLILHNRQGRVGDQALVSPHSIAVMHSPPPGIDTSYGMGWLSRQENGQPVLEHNGIFSAYYAEVVLLPEEEIGIALLYNTGSLPATAFAFPQIKNGLIALLGGRPPSTGGFSVTHFGILMGLLTLAGGGLALSSLMRLPRWASRAEGKPSWRLVPGIVWAFTPALSLAAMPWLSSAGSGRFFGYAALWRSMPDLFIWLGITGALGLVNGILRLRWIAGRGLSSRREAELRRN